MHIPRRNHSQSDYIDAAIAFANANGMEAMTMRSLGEAMGVDATAVYRHFPTKEKLIEAMVDWFFGVVREVTLEYVNSTPRERCLNFAKSYRATFEKFPNIGGSVSSSSGSSMNGYFASKVVIEALMEMGLTGSDLVESYQSLEGFVLGSCMQDFTGSPENWNIRRIRYRAFEIEAFDDVAVKAEFVKLAADNAFNSGLNVLLDKCEARVH